MESTKKIYIPQRKKIALVCSGGAAKAGAFHMGVCRALEEKGFSFKGGLRTTKKEGGKRHKRLEIDTYVGSSAGSFICSYLTAGYGVDEIFNSYLGKGHKSGALTPLTYKTLLSLKKSPHEANLRFTDRLKDFANKATNMMTDRRLLAMSGFFSTSGIESYLRNEVLSSNQFNDYKSDLFIVATQLNHSKRVIFSKKKLPSPKDDKTCEYNDKVSISDAVAASTALPPIFCPYGIKNERGRTIYYFDGEIRETLSTHVAEDAGADLVISSYTHQPYHFSREIGSLTKFGLPAICIQAIYLMVERKIQLSRYNKLQKLAALDSVYQYCVEQNISERHRNKLCEILELKLSLNPNCKHISIHPRPSDHEMFFGDHFNLSRSYVEKIVRIGFLSAIDCLRKYEFEGNP